MRNHRKDGMWLGSARAWIVLGVLALVMILAPTVPAAEEANLIKNGDAETGSLDNWGGFTGVVSEDVHGGNHCFSRRGNGTVLSRELIPIDPGKTYTITGWCKSVGTGPSKLYFGCAPCDENRKAIPPEHVICIPGSETTLFEACDKADTVIKIANGEKWQLIVHGRIAFEVDDSGNYEDLPNGKLSSSGMTKVENKGDHWEVHLKKPCGQSYAAGTKIREHISGGTYMYSAASNTKVPMEWTQYTAKIKGEAKHGYSGTQWRRGTKYARIMLLANYQQKKEFELLVDDISMTASDE